LLNTFPRDIQARCNFIERGAHIQNVFCWIVMHLADFIDVVIEAGNLRFLFGENFLRFGNRPCEVVSIIIHGVIGILRGIEAAMGAVAQPFVHPADDVGGYIGEKLRAGGLIAVHVILQQFRVVVGHLLEVGNDPAFVDGITMKAAGQVIVNAATRHFLQCGDEDVAQAFVAGTHITVDEEIENCRVRKFGCVAKAAVVGVEHAEGGIDDVVHNFGFELACAASEGFRP
jgi:hypothetical protein